MSELPNIATSAPTADGWSEWSVVLHDGTLLALGAEGEELAREYVERVPSARVFRRSVQMQTGSWQEAKP